VVAERYRIGRDSQDAYALESQRLTAAAQAAGRFDEEIVALATSKIVIDRETKEKSLVDVTLERDEGNRADTTAEGLAGLAPVIDGGTVTAGNASQLSDGAAATLLMERDAAVARGLEPLGVYRPGVRRAEASASPRSDRR